jgi:hypothetical protein
LHVNKEARGAGLKFYSNFLADYMMENEKNIFVPYNPKAGLVYFGNKTDICAMIGFFQKGIGVPRVAIFWRVIAVQNCHWESEDGDEQWDMIEGWGVPGGVNPLQALHGFDPDVVEGNKETWPGCKGLEEVIFVPRDHFWGSSLMKNTSVLRLYQYQKNLAIG